MTSTAVVPVSTMVPISRFGRGGSSAEFAKAQDGTPVTVLRNNEPTYFILNRHDYLEYCDLKAEVNEMRNREARREALNHEYEHAFSNVEELGKWMDTL